jgi:hypothetical protein
VGGHNGFSIPQEYPVYISPPYITFDHEKYKTFASTSHKSKKIFGIKL